MNIKTNKNINWNVPLHWILGGAPTYPVWHLQWNPPGVFEHIEYGPHGWARHSSMSTHTDPLALNPFLQKHWPSVHSALVVQSKLDLHNTVTSTYG